MKGKFVSFPASMIATLMLAALPVTAPDVQGGDYASFERIWTVDEKPVTHYRNEKIFTVTYSGPLSMSEFKVWWKSFGEAAIEGYAERMMAEVQKPVSISTLETGFFYLASRSCFLGFLAVSMSNSRDNFSSRVKLQHRS